MSVHTSPLMGLDRFCLWAGLVSRALFRRDFSLSRVTPRALGATLIKFTALAESFFSLGFFLSAEESCDGSPTQVGNALGPIL